MNRNWIAFLAGAFEVYGIVAFCMAVAHITPTIEGGIILFVIGCIIGLFDGGVA